MNVEGEKVENSASVHIVILGRTFDTGPLSEDEQSDLRVQLRDARREVMAEMHDLDMGRRPDWMLPDGSIDDALMMMRLQLKVFQAILDQIPEPNPGGGGVVD